MDNIQESRFAGTTIGKLKEMLVMESDGKLIVIPKGSIIEVSSEEEYPHTVKDEDLADAVRYLSDNE